MASSLRTPPLLRPLPALTSKGQITLTHIKHSEFASEETNCFETLVCIDGTPAAVVSNDGHGGPNRWSDWELCLALNEFAKTLPGETTDYPDPKDPGKMFVYQPDADAIVDDLVTTHLIARDLTRAMGGKILMTFADGKIRETKRLPPADKARLLADNAAGARKAFPKAVAILNALPFEEALEIYRKAA